MLIVLPTNRIIMIIVGSGTLLHLIFIGHHNQFNYYIPENSPYTLLLKRSCNIKFLLNVELCILHSDTDPDSQPIAKARVLHVCIIPLFVSVALPRSRTVAICPTGMKRENIGCNVVTKLASLA